ncbi:MAG: VOC family protein [Alphaproteobacteria bacterium]|nr:VOC family protein [Alphaproteobacteria bacterium]
MGDVAEHQAAAIVDPVRIGAVALAVQDLARVEAFYRGVIGLERVLNDADGVLLGAGGIGFLHLHHRPDAAPDDPSAAGLYHTAFLLPSRADLGSWLAHAGRLRTPLEGAADHLVSEALYLSDPEGNGVEVYADRPRAAWRWTDGQVAMATLPLDFEAVLAAASPAWSGAPPGTRIGHVHLRVGDVAAAVEFWTGRIGLDLVAALPGAAFLSSGGYHHHIAVNTWRSRGAAARDRRRAGLASVTLAVAQGTRAAAAPAMADPWGTAVRVAPA